MNMRPSVRLRFMQMVTLVYVKKTSQSEFQYTLTLFPQRTASHRYPGVFVLIRKRVTGYVDLGVC